LGSIHRITVIQKETWSAFSATPVQAHLFNALEKLTKFQSV
jgi:hypothetical protein